MNSIYSSKEFHKNVSEKKSEIANRWLISTSVIALLFFLQVIYRASVIGVTFSTFIQLSAFCSVWTITLLRNRLSFKARAVFLVSIVSLSALVGAFQLGIMGYGLIVIVFSAPLITLFFELRTALIVLVVQTIIGVLIAYYHVRLGVLPSFDYVAYLTSPTAWIVEISTYVGLAILLSLSTSSLLNYFITALADLSQKASELSLSEKENRRILDQMVNPFCRLDTDGKIVLTSKSVVGIFGQTSESLQGNNLLGLLDKPEQMARFLQEVKNNPDEPQHLELSITPLNRPQIICVFRAQCWQSEEGKTLGIEGTFADITEQRAALQSMYHERKLKASGLMAAGISHDFNNNLSVILGCLEALEPEFPETPETEKLLKLAYLAGDKAVKLSHRLQKLSPNGTPTTSEQIDISDAVSSFMPLLSRIVPSTIKIHFSRTQEPLQIDVDCSAFEDVIFNLVANARDAMADRGEIFIETHAVEISEAKGGHWPGVKKGAYAAITVRDTGHGIPAEDRERIFEPFFTSKDHESGTGLGLSIAAGFVASSNGFIRVNSAVGEGSQFDILFPASPPIV